MINSSKLDKELKAAGISILGCNSNGVVWDVDGNEIQDRQDVAAVIAAHNPNTPMWDDIRKERDALLVKCDWTQLADAALTFEEKAAWSDYRQALRDIPQTFENPEDVIFPSVPGGA